MEYDPEKFVSLIYSLISDLTDSKILKYERKMINAYINQTIQLVHRKETHLHTKFLLTICMVSVILRIEEDKNKVLEDSAFQRIKVELVESLCRKEISRIRAIILDLYTGSYADETLHTPKPEPWAVKIVADLSKLLPDAKSEQFVQGNRMVMAVLHGYLEQEIKEAFLSKAIQFGKKGNQLVINILYIDKYFRKYVPGASMDSLVKAVQENFRDRDQAEKTADLLKYIE